MSTDRKSDKSSNNYNEDGMNLQAMNKEIENYSTDPNLIKEIDSNCLEIIKDFSGDPDLELFKIKYETLYNSLKESYENEIRWIKKCKENNSEIVLYVAKVQSAIKMAQEDEAQGESFKKDWDDRNKKIDELKKKEEEFREKIHYAKLDIQQLTIAMEKGLDDVEVENQRQIDNQNKIIEEQTKNFHSLQARLTQLRTTGEQSLNELKEAEDKNSKHRTAITNFENQIREIRNKTKKEEERKLNMDKEVDLKKARIDEAKREQDLKAEQIKENRRINEQTSDDIKARSKEKEHVHEMLGRSEKEFLGEKTQEKTQQEAVAMIEKQIEDQREQRKKKQEEVEEAKKTLATVKKEYEIMRKKVLDITSEREDMEKLKNHLQGKVEIFKENNSKLLMERGSLDEEIDHKHKEHSQNLKNLKKVDDEDHDLDGSISYLQNKLKKLENQVRGYQIEAQKLNKIITLLEKEQEKYGIEASQAHAKYYQTIEEVKIKNNMIAELQKKNAEVEAKLKHQQNLYEAVRSDRNLYSKNLLESQEENEELSKKHSRMKQQVEQLKEEIKVKNSNLMKQDYDFNKIGDENEKAKNDKDRLKNSIKGTEDVIKNQENNISRLKYIISKANSEKQKQDKDLDMVLNERDILGTQLIKRNQELFLLYEKNKLSHSNLAKGEIYFREKHNELKHLKEDLVSLRRELQRTEDQVSCTKDLINEANALEKDLLNERTRVKALEDELQIKMNVHRWRKLEATDQENFERILKIQTLQRRLIAKTEEVFEKENLIKEKEKLFMELKNILARQPGAEIHQQLENYKQSLKDKSYQMKKMLAELKNSQDQVDVLKFDINRLQEEMHGMKREFYKRRQQEDSLKNDRGNQYEINSNVAAPRYNVQPQSMNNKNFMLEGSQNLIVS